MKYIILFLFSVAVLSLTACQQTKHGAVSQAAKDEQRTADAVTKNKARVRELSAEEFKQLVMNYEIHPQEWVYEGKHPALIDFYATWCGPCKAMAPVVEEIAEKYVGKIDVYKVDVDKEEELAALFGIQSIPSLLLVPMEGKPQMSVGALGRQELDKAVQTVLLNSHSSQSLTPVKVEESR